MTLNSKAVRRVAVYCGSANGNDPAFLAEAKALGTAIAAAGLGLVYGGASAGLMGAVADAALAGGAEVIGVLPDVLAGKEIAHAGLTRLELVSTMHERKARMAELADAFLVLAGRVRNVRGAAGSGDLGAVAAPCQADHPHQHRKLLAGPSCVPGHSGGRGIFEAEEPGVDAGGGECAQLRRARQIRMAIGIALGRGLILEPSSENQRAVVAVWPSFSNRTILIASCNGKEEPKKTAGETLNL